jgi:hypothetical protein
MKPMPLLTASPWRSACRGLHARAASPRRARPSTAPTGRATYPHRLAADGRACTYTHLRGGNEVTLQLVSTGGDAAGALEAWKPT